MTRKKIRLPEAARAAFEAFVKEITIPGRDKDARIPDWVKQPLEIREAWERVALAAICAGCYRELPRQ